MCLGDHLVEVDLVLENYLLEEVDEVVGEDSDANVVVKELKDAVGEVAGIHPFLGFGCEGLDEPFGRALASPFKFVATKMQNHLQEYGAVAFDFVLQFAGEEVVDGVIVVDICIFIEHVSQLNYNV